MKIIVHIVGLLLVLALCTFIVFYGGLCWSLSIIHRDSFINMATGVFPIIASLVFTIVFMTTMVFATIRYAVDLKSVIVDVFYRLARFLLKDTLSGRSAQEQIRELGLLSFDIGDIRRWGIRWSTATKIMAAGWLALFGLALFRVQIIQYNAIVVVLLASMFIALFFKRWGIAVGFCVAVGIYFLLVDAKIIDDVKPGDANPKETITKSEEIVPEQEVVIYGGMVGWVTAYRDLPFTNRFKVENLGGSLQIAGSKSEQIDFRGSLRANGIPFTLNANHFLNAGIKPEHWLVHGDGVAPYCLIACVTEQGVSPHDAVPFKVDWKLVVEKGKSLHFWYNHIIEGKYKESYKGDSGSYRFKLVPMLTGE